MRAAVPLLQVIAPVAPSVRARRPLSAVAIQGGAATLDVTIGCCVIALLIIVTTGGVDLGWVSVTRASRPFLVLCVLLPIRLAQPGPAWLHRGAWLRAVGARAGRFVDAHVSDGVRDCAFAFVVSRIGAVAIGFFVNLLFPPDRARPWQLPFDKATLAETFAAWDSGWYFDIASRGYYYSATGESSVAFFPLYPMTMRMVAWPFGSSDAAIWSAGVGISMTCFLAGLLVLHERNHPTVPHPRRPLLWHVGSNLKCARQRLTRLQGVSEAFALPAKLVRGEESVFQQPLGLIFNALNPTRYAFASG